MRVPSTRRLGAGLAAVALAFGIAACSSSGGSSGSKLELTNVKVAILSETDSAPLIMGIKDGFFKQQGLNVSYEIVPSIVNSMSLIESHAIQFTSLNYVNMYTSELADPSLGLRLIEDDTQATPGLFDFMVAKNSKITSLADLKGKTLSVPSTGVFNYAEMSLDVLGKPYGINANSVKYVALPFQSAPAALASGKLDVAFTTEPFITLMEEESGARVLIDMMSGPLAGMPQSAWGTTSYFTKNDPNTVAAFARGMQESLRKAASDPEAVRQALPEFIPHMTSSLASVILLPTFNTTLSLKRMDRVADEMEALGQLPASFVKNVVPQMYDPAYTSSQ